MKYKNKQKKIKGTLQFFQFQRLEERIAKLFIKYCVDKDLPQKTPENWEYKMIKKQRIENYKKRLEKIKKQKENSND